MLMLLGLVIAATSGLSGLGLLLTAISVGTAVAGVAFQVLKARSDKHQREIAEARVEATAIAVEAKRVADRALQAEESRHEFEKAMMGTKGEPELGIPPIPGVFQRVHRLEVIHTDLLQSERLGNEPKRHEHHRDSQGR